jgi:hypothetical protein
MNIDTAMNNSLERIKKYTWIYFIF